MGGLATGCFRYPPFRLPWARLAAACGTRAALLCLSLHPPQSVAACPPRVAERILYPTWARNRARGFTVHRSWRRPSARPRRGSKPTDGPCRRGTSACSASRGQPSHRRPSAMPSTLATAISKSDVSAATPTRPSRSTSCGGRRQLRFMNWNATCAAASAPKSEAIHTSGVRWSRCGLPRFQRAIRRRFGGREISEDRRTDVRVPPRGGEIAGQEEV